MRVYRIVYYRSHPYDAGYQTAHNVVAKKRIVKQLRSQGYGVRVVATTAKVPKRLRA